MSIELTPTVHDVLCKSNKMNHNIFDLSAAEFLMDRKAVGTPAIGGLSRRHSVTLPTSKFSSNLLLGLKMEPFTAVCNKENHFRDRSYSDSGEKLFQKPSAHVNSSRYKTELCRPFEENGSCKYGDKCQFAHGLHELRSLIRHHKYKTELCRTFHTIGFCPYGSRCHFIHNAEERRWGSLHDQAELPFPTSKTERPKFQHSLSFAGFPTTSGLLESTTSTTPPLLFETEDFMYSPTFHGCASNPFTFSSKDLPNLFTPSMGIQIPLNPGNGPGSPPLLFQPIPESSRVSETPLSPLESLSDQEDYLTCSSSDSDSPTIDTTKRLPIFSRLSVSDD
ncbi:mRNA decay activator protein ZFP36L1 [Pelodytes ibericus]